MADVDWNAQSSLIGEPPSDQRQTRGASGEKRAGRLWATLLSSIFPGVGQLISGQLRKGAILLIIFVALLVCFWPLRLPRFFSGFLFLCYAWVALYLYSSASVFTRSALYGKPSRWWLVGILPITFLASSLIGAGAARVSGFRSFGIPSTSMEKTIEKGDHVVVDTFRYRNGFLGRQEVAVFLRSNTYFVKRVIAVGGDTIQGKAGQIVVNGAPLEEPYVQHTGNPPSWMDTFGPLTIPPGNLFVMGDNRDISLDSRSPEFGFVTSGSVIGKPLYVFGSDRTGNNIK